MIFFFFLLNLPQLAAAPVAQPHSSQHIPFLGSVYTGKGLPGRLTSPRSSGCGARVEQSQAPAFPGCCFSQLGRPPLGPAVGCQLPAASPPPAGTPAGMAPIRPIQSCRHPCPQPGPEGLSWKWISLEGRASAFPLLKGLRSALPGDLRAERLTLPAQVWGPSGSWEGPSAFNPSTLAVGGRVTKGLPEAAVLRC